METERRRKSIRLPGYDYSTPGGYFVTIVTERRLCLLGETREGCMQLSDAGDMIERWWRELPNKYPSMETDSFVVMPNHVHGVIILNEADEFGGDGARSATSEGGHVGPPYDERVRRLRRSSSGSRR